MEIYDTAIIGAGPAGLTAAIYTSRARLKTVIFENPAISSQAAYAYRIENYPGFPEGISGMELSMSFRKQAETFGAGFVAGGVDTIASSKQKGTDLWQIKIGDKIYNTLSVIIASGARAKKLKVAGEEKFRGRGVSYCASCDGAFFKDKDIVVVGGGNTAVEEALFLTRFAKKVILIHRRNRLRAIKILQEQALSNKKIEIILNSIIDEIKGGEKVEAVRVKDLAKNKEKDLPCEGVFISVGFMPNTDFVKGTVEMDENGYIIADNSMRTSKKGIFACGDCRNTPLRQIITACGDGALAASSCQQYIDELKGTVYK